MYMISNNNVVLETNLENQNLINRGKVRDLYDMGDSLLIDALASLDVTSRVARTLLDPCKEPCCNSPFARHENQEHLPGN